MVVHRRGVFAGLVSGILRIEIIPESPAENHRDVAVGHSHFHQGVSQRPICQKPFPIRRTGICLMNCRIAT